MDDLETLGVGAHVALYGYYVELQRSSIKRLTKTQIIIDNGSKFNRRTGHKVGGDCWSRVYIQKWSNRHKEELREAAVVCKRNRIVNDIRRLSANSLTEKQVSLLSQVLHIAKAKES